MEQTATAVKSERMMMEPFGGKKSERMMMEPFGGKWVGGVRGRQSSPPAPCFLEQVADSGREAHIKLSPLIQILGQGHLHRRFNSPRQAVVDDPGGEDELGVAVGLVAGQKLGIR